MSTDQELTFDERNIAQVKALSKELLETCPELRSISILFDYKHDLNQVAKTAVWATRSGTYEDAGEIFNALEQTGRLMAKQSEAAIVLIGRMAAQVQELERQRQELLDEREGPAPDGS